MLPDIDIDTEPIPIDNLLPQKTIQKWFNINENCSPCDNNFNFNYKQLSDDDPIKVDSEQIPVYLNEDISDIIDKIDGFIEPEIIVSDINSDSDSNPNSDSDSNSNSNLKKYLNLEGVNVNILEKVISSPDSKEFDHMVFEDVPDIVCSVEPPEILEFPLTFDSETLDYNFINFHGADTKVVNNPIPIVSESCNASRKVVQIKTPTDTSYSTLKLHQPIDFTAKKSFKILVWTSSKSAALELFFINNQDQIFGLEPVQVPVSNSWVELTFDFLNETEHDDFKFQTIAFNVSGEPGLFYFDNIRLV